MIACKKKRGRMGHGMGEVGMVVRGWLERRASRTKKMVGTRTLCKAVKTNATRYRTRA